MYFEKNLFKQVVAYYNAYNTFKSYGDPELVTIMENRLEELLRDLVRCFEDAKMYDWESHLRYNGIFEGAGDKDVVQDILYDVKELMDGDLND